MDNNNDNYDVNNAVAENDQVTGEQARTSDDTSDGPRASFDDADFGEHTSIGNENYEADGGADLGFEEPGIDEDEDRENPLRRAPGGGTSDGTNEGNYRGGKGNSGGNIRNLSGQYDTTPSS